MKKLLTGMPKLVKFCITGVINTGIDFSVFAVLAYAGVFHPVAQCISYSCGVTNSYLMNRSWTFQEVRKGNSERAQFIRFVFVNVIVLALTTAILTLLYSQAGWSLAVSKIAATLAGIGLNYSGSRLWVFKETTIRGRERS